MHPVIAAPVGIIHWQVRQFGVRDVVQAGNIDRDEVASDFRNVSATEWLQAASTAEKMVALQGAELIVREKLRARQQAERRRFDEHAPVARLPANRAVALAGARREIGLPLEADAAAMATATAVRQHSS